MGGSSKSQTVGYNYLMSAHLVFFKGIYDSITRITFRDVATEAWSGNLAGSGTININQPNLFGGSTSQGGVVGSIDVMDGNPTQTPNAYLVGLRGGYVPAYRRVTSLVMRNFNIGMNPYPPVLGLEGYRIHQRPSLDGLTVRPQWYDAKAAIPFTTATNLTATHWDYKVVSSTNSDTSFKALNYTLDGSWTINQSTAPFVGGGSGWAMNDGSGNPTYMWYRFNFTPYSNQPIYLNIGGSIDPVDVWLNGNFIGTYLSATQVYIAVSQLIQNANNVIAMRSRSGIVGVPAHYEYKTTFTSTAPDFNSKPMVAVNYYMSFYHSLNPTINPYFVSFVYIGDYINSAVVNINNGTGGDSYVPNWVYQYVAATPDQPNTVTFQQLGNNKFGMNAVHIIREAYTEPDYGNPNDESLFPDSVWQPVADQVYSEGLGMTATYDGSMSLDDFISDIKRHINAETYIDRKDGKFKIKLIRNDYNVSTLISLNESNISDVSDFKQVAFGQLTTSVTVNYTDISDGWVDGAVTVQDIALAQQQVKSIPTNVNYKGFLNFKTAALAAQRDLKTLSSQLISCVITTNLIAKDLNKGDVFKWSWAKYGITNLVMRVTDINFGDGKTNEIKITCIQDVFSLPSTAVLTQPTTSWTPPFSAPTALTNTLVIEAPYLELVQSFGQGVVDSQLTDDPDSGYVTGIAGRSSNATKAVMYDGVSGNYDQVGIVDFCPTASLNANIGLNDVTFAITAGTDLNLVNVGDWFQIDNEIFCVNTISSTSITVKRGCLDTLPANHLSGAIIYFWDNHALVDKTEYVIGNTVNTKLLTVNPAGQLALSDAPEIDVLIVGRAAMPYNMANLQMNGSYFPSSITGDLVLTWANRNRLQQTSGTIYGFLDGNITPESGVTYNIYLIDPDTYAIYYSSSSITGTSLTINAATLSGFPYSLILKIESVRSGIKSYQTYLINFANLNTKVRATTDGFNRIVTTSEMRVVT